MYTHHFKMNDTPFMEQPSSKYLFKDNGIDSNLARLRYFSESGRIALVTGMTGVGKTSLLRFFALELEEKNIEIIHIKVSKLGSTAVLRMLVALLGETPAYAREKLFLQLEEKSIRTGKTILFEIDDAHLLDPDVLIDLRLLSDMSLDSGEPNFQIILCGQEELLRTLKQDRFTDLRDRINVQVRIHPLVKVSQTELYLERQIKSVGGRAKIFSPEAISRIHAHTGGVYRRINNVAISSLIAATASNASSVDESIALKAIQEML